MNAITFKSIEPVMKAAAQRQRHHSTSITGAATAGSSRARRFPAFLAAFLAVAFAVPGGPAKADAPDVLGVRVDVEADVTRFEVELTGPVDFEVVALDDPDRVALDLSAEPLSLLAATSSLLDEGLRLEKGMIAGLRHGAFGGGRSRIELDTTGPARVRAYLLEPGSGRPYRLALDIEPRGDGASLAGPADTIDAMAGSGPPRPAAKPEPTRRTIVLDPGHGGDDPGAIGASGTYEKRLVLKAADELKGLLEATGDYRVIMTRDSDVYLRLGERVELARAAGADLFISIHADSIENPSVRGAGVYTLSETASDAEAAALAQKENKSDLIAGVDLINIAYDPVTTDILIDLIQRETKNASSEFARLLTAELNAAVALRGNAHRFAGFRVLKAPDVPSVLIEMGFLSNAAEERDMLDVAFRRRFMVAVVEAIDDFFAARRS